MIIMIAFISDKLSLLSQELSMFPLEIAVKTLSNKYYYTKVKIRQQDLPSIKFGFGPDPAVLTWE